MTTECAVVVCKGEGTGERDVQRRVAFESWLG